jgi:hypothetical protein
MAEVTLKLREYLEAHHLNARQVELEAGIGQNTIYRVIRATNLNRNSLAGIIRALRKLTGKPVGIADVLEYSDSTLESDQQIAQRLLPQTLPGDPAGYLALIGLFGDAQSPGDLSANHDAYLGRAQEDEFLEQSQQAPPSKKRKTTSPSKSGSSKSGSSKSGPSKSGPSKR